MSDRVRRILTWVFWGSAAYFGMAGTLSRLVFDAQYVNAAAFTWWHPVLAATISMVVIGRLVMDKNVIPEKCIYCWARERELNALEEQNKRLREDNEKLASAVLGES